MKAAGDALRYLSDGKRRRARDVAGAVGWGPRTGGSRMRALERQGYVSRVLVRKAGPGTSRPRSDPLYEWVLTEKGHRFVG